MRSHLKLPLPLLLALRAHLGRHRTPSLITLFAIASSVTLAAALDISTSSIEVELTGTAESLAGAAEVEILGGTLGVPEELVAAVATVPGVQTAAPLVTATGRLDSADASGPSIHILGVDTRVRSTVQSYLGDKIAVASLLMGDTDAILVSPVLSHRLNLRTGDSLSVRLAGRPRQLAIRGILPPRGIAEAYGGEIALMDVRSLQASLGRHGWLDRIEVVLSPGSSATKVIAAMRSEVGDRGIVCRAAGRNAWVETALLMLRILVSTLIGIASVVASLVSCSALSWFVDRLTPELVLLNAAGLEPQRLRRLLYIDAGLLAVLGTGVGMVCGRLLSESFLRGFSWLSAFIQGVELQHLTFRASTLATGAVVGGVVSIAGILGPARRASQLFPLDTGLGSESRAGGESRRNVNRVLAGGLIALFFIAAVLPSIPLPIRVASILGAALAGLGIAVDVLLPSAVANSRRALDVLFPGIGRLVGIGLAAHRSRTALTVACVGAVTAAVALSINLTGSTARTLDAWLNSQFSGGVLVTTGPLFSTQPAEVILPETVATIRQTPNVMAVFEEASEKVIYRGEEALLVAGNMNVLARYGRLQVVDGSPGSIAEELTNGQIAISERFAQHFGIRQGDLVMLNTPKGRRSLRVAGIIRDYAGPTGSLNIDIGIFEQLWPRQGSRDVVFWTLGDPTTVVSAIRGRIANKQPLLFSYGAKLAHFVTDQIWRVRGILVSVALMTALLGAVAVSSLLLSSVTVQPRELGLLLATGATRAQVRAIKLLEGLFVGISGGIVGIALGVGTSYVLISDVLPQGIGWTLNFSVDPAELLLLTLCLAVSSCQWCVARANDPYL